MGQLSDPQGQGEDDEISIVLADLPGEPLEPLAPAGAARGEAGDGDTGGGTAGGEHDESVFELDAWSDIERDVVADRLREAGVPHWWVDTELHVADTDRSVVENILDEVEGEPVPLDPERDQIAYDMSEWDDDRLTRLVERLDEAGIPMGWDGDELFVHADDEQAVDELIDEVAHPDELPAEPDDGEPAGDLLGELFVAADRLRRDAVDHEATASLLETSRTVERSGPPYGLAARDWEHIRERLDGLVDLVLDDPIDEDRVLAAAAELRTSLRPYV